ncbi:hypothetical protein [Streptantibioticus ferralitis]|uniref:Histidine phosphatase family protein n=1 Tax=Streptantibioticus ferralitis TaxID=236510 RepID=A0ABT5ZB31_9ACTN|nr:hypothetical protein [Streptantibioticus ferralitis]MDF2261053.1 hypothetical protein [Streptantibioticus ferralitis]
MTHSRTAADMPSPERTDSNAGAVSRRWVLAGLAAAAPVLLAGCGSKGSHKAAPAPADASSAGTSADTVIMIIRHGEKPDASHPGIGDNGHQDSKSLTQRGWDRANALPKLFDPPRSQPLATGIERPRTIYAATDQGPHAGAHRMRQTVTPLAHHMGLTLNTTYAESQEAALATAALAAPEPVLICWEHSRIPAIVKALGASHTGVPATWPNRFDLVWVFTRTHGTWTFRQVDQHLLPGDA